MPEVKSYHRPASVEEALRLLVQKGKAGAILAGGTRLVPELEDDVTDIIDLQAVGLDRIEITKDQIVLGVMTRLQAIVENESIPTVVRGAARREGPNTLRNAATVGGVLVGSDWESEFCAAMLAYGGVLTVQTAGDICEVPLEEFEASEYADGIVTRVAFARGGAAAHERVARTPADSPIVAVIGRVDEQGRLRLAFCGVAERPILLLPDETGMLNPPGDFRGSLEYRRAMASTLAERVIRALS